MQIICRPEGRDPGSQIWHRKFDDHHGQDPSVSQKSCAHEVEMCILGEGPEPARDLAAIIDAAVTHGALDKGVQ